MQTTSACIRPGWRVRRSIGPEIETAAITRPDGPRTGAETPVDAEDLVHARGQDVTDATLRRAREDLDAEGAAAVEREVPDLGR